MKSQTSSSVLSSVSALLLAFIEAAEDVLATAEIKGEAVFLYGVRSIEAGHAAVTGAQAGTAAHALLVEGPRGLRPPPPA